MPNSAPLHTAEGSPQLLGRAYKPHVIVSARQDLTEEAESKKESATRY